MVNSCLKGKRYERHVANRLTEILHVKCRRGQQRSGLDQSDVIGLKGVHIEAKHNERLNLYDAIDQSVGDSGGDVPIVVHTKNNKPDLLTIRLDDLKQFVKAIVALDPLDRISMALTELGEVSDFTGDVVMGDVDATDYKNWPNIMTHHDKKCCARAVEILEGNDD